MIAMQHCSGKQLQCLFHSNTDTIPPNISLALYRCLCQNIVGTEDRVKTIRLMNAMRDNLSTNKMGIFITSGSFGEGLEMRGSDLDMMMSYKHLEVDEYEKPCFHSSKTYFSMEQDDIKPGFTLLRLKYCDSPYIFKYCEEDNGKLYFSSALHKRKILFESTRGETIHGACIADKKGYFDFANSLHCKTWISPAIQWITRSSHQISNFHRSIRNFPIEEFTLYVKDVEKLVNSTMMFCANGTLTSSSMLDILNIRVSCQQSSQKHLFKYYMSLWFNGQSQCLTLDIAISSKKHKYKQYKSCLSNLLKNVYHDAVFGWLMTASFFYKTKQYSKALHIIMYSISKCTPDKLYYGMTMSDIHYQSLRLQSFQKKSVVYLLKKMFVDKIQFKMKSKLIPDEILMDEWNEGFLFPSTAYAYFLGFLCHYTSIMLDNVRISFNVYDWL
ncbi:STK24_25_MST4 [Mytilus coruscus]|uniref:STK24_25_MST4 n=1 Tax=Mytilus coruscus TaxID=42192 RepID=A0A6J8BIT1_MYTCO|nr:STK24_25_MST4 [Mytilus coruscus]